MVGYHYMLLIFTANAPPRTNYPSLAYLSARGVDENMLP